MTSNWDTKIGHELNHLVLVVNLVKGVKLQHENPGDSIRDQTDSSPSLVGEKSHHFKL